MATSREVQSDALRASAHPTQYAICSAHLTALIELTDLFVE